MSASARRIAPQSPLWRAGALLALAGGCASPPPAPHAPGTTARGTAAGPAPVPPAPAPAKPTSSAGVPPGEPTPAAPRSCGELGCLAFATPRAAFEYALRGTPQIVAVGESHAQKDSPPVPSVTARFRSDFLPVLVGRAKGMVIELLLPDKRCAKSETQAVAKRQEAVTKPQAETNQNEFVTLARSAKELGIVPQPLVPTCSELRAVLAAGEADIDAMLKLIADLTVREASALLDQAGGDGVVLTYGGLVHNDASPRPGREAWSFGPRLRERSSGRYVEIDLIVPEFVRPAAPWTNLPWYAPFTAAPDSAETRLFEPAPGSFVLIFPRTPQPSTPPPALSTPP